MKFKLEKIRYVFVVLAGIVLIQLAWWAYLIVSQQKLIAQLSTNPEANQKAQSYSIMILSEATFVAIVWLIGTYMVWKAIASQIQLVKTQSDFANAVTHELKTPISNIRLCLDTLKRPDLSEENRTKYLNRANLATDNLLEQIEKILILATKREKENSYQYFSVKDCLDKCIKNLNMKESFQFKFIGFDNNPSVYVAPAESEIIISSILSNAKKYSANNKNIEIQFSESKKYYELNIKDFGLGIKSEDIDNVFKAFWRSEQAKDLAIGGTGVGLSIAQNLAKSHNMKISIESQGADKGTEVKIFWQRIKKQDPILNSNSQASDI